MMFAIISVSSYAVDGYKEFKFGMSVSKVKQLCPIHLEQIENKDGIRTLSGEGMRFAGEKTEVAFIFIDEKLVRIAFKVPENKVAAITKGIYQKYGEPSTPIDPEQFKAVATSPNTEAVAGFDNDTVTIRFISGSDNEKTVVVNYSDEYYDEKIISSQQAGLQGDL